MNTKSKTIIIFVTGLFVGILVMSVLSSRASKTYIDVIKSNYKAEQHLSGKQAMKDQDYLLAIHYYKNLVDASTSSPQNIFHEAENIWKLSFPFAAEILNKIKAHTDPDDIGKERDNGLNHGMLAYALEKYGMHDKAKVEWEKASKILGQQDIGKIKQLIENIN